jgi:hypothetical protein
MNSVIYPVGLIVMVMMENNEVGIDVETTVIGWRMPRVKQTEPADPANVIKPPGTSLRPFC